MRNLGFWETDTQELEEVNKLMLMVLNIKITQKLVPNSPDIV
jgi:hypothetical protein